ncbi:tetratricopeptide repeat protein [Chryseobacterium sp. MYb328]|uniref:tetratricopeptide repeat protein n=1 Tax=Chryseobacterium sp. MYb328 TaxID=2745231 RepID=UPI00309FC92D
MYDNLEQLFYRGDLDQCIIEGEQYLLSHPEDEEVLFLMAVAYHDIVYYEGHEAVYDAIRDYVIPYLRRILQINPNSEKALYNILNYPLGNEYALMQIARTKKHITQENKAEFIGYAERMLEDPDCVGYGYDFLVKIYESLEENKALLNSLEAAMYYSKKAHADNREIRDKNTSLYWIRKIYLLDHTKIVSGEELTGLIDKEHITFVSRNEYDFINLADIAFENNAPDLSLKMMLKAIKGENSAVHIHEKLVEWHQRFAELIRNGYNNNPDVFYYQLIIERNYNDLLNVSADFYYHHALEVINSHPALFSGYHFAGTFLYENERYAEAIPLLEKAVQLSSDATAWRRRADSEYLLNGTVLSNIPVFSDYPADIYNEGVYLNECIDALEDENDKLKWHEVGRIVYEQAYEAFRKYFEEDRFESDYHNDLHTRAMCCNNLAIKYWVLGDYKAAAATASEGLTYSEFMELHLTLIDALMDGGDHKRAEEALNNYFSLYGGSDDYCSKTLYYRARQIQLHEVMGSSDVQREAQEVLTSIYQYTIENPELEDDNYRDLEAGKNILEGILFQHLDNQDLNTRKSYYEQVAMRFPGEANPQFALMQIYNEEESYGRVALAAKRYLENKKEFLLDAFDRAKTIYMMVKSDFLQGNYQEAASVFSQYDADCESAMDPEEYVLWLSYGVRVYEKLNNKDQTLALAERFTVIYNAEEWGYDDLVESVELSKAVVLYHAGNVKEAHAILDQVRSVADYDPIADEYKASWKKPGLFSKFGF